MRRVLLAAVFLRAFRIAVVQSVLFCGVARQGWAQLSRSSPPQNAVANARPADATKQQSSSQDESSVESRVRLLIEQLADPSYSTRLNAQAELERIGVLALDQLHSASFHPDPQVSSLAKYIVQSNQFTWAWETDSSNVRQILSNYSNVALAEKSACIDQLHRLEHDEGFVALCRLVRYETQSVLAKRAALLLLRSGATLKQSLESKKEQMASNVQGSHSVASKWIERYATSQNDFDLKWWMTTLEKEVESLRANTGETSVEITSDLHRWIVEEIALLPKYRSEAIRIGESLLSVGSIVPTLDSMTGYRTSRAEEYAHWALKHGLPELVQKQHSLLPYSTISREFIFGYLLAESFLLQGKEGLAGGIANYSREQIPCDADGNRRVPTEAEMRNPIRSTLDNLLDRRGSSESERRRMIGAQLRERGQFAWAEEEFRLSLSRKSQSRDGEKKDGQFDSDLLQASTLITMTMLAEMLHWQSRFQEAGDVLQPFIDRYTQEPMFERQIKAFSQFQPDEIISMYQLYRGDQARDEARGADAIKHYKESLAKSPSNVDALIGMYRVQLSEQERLDSRSLLKTITNNMRQAIRQDEDTLKLSSNLNHAFNKALVADKANTLSWLIANTEGSKEEALFLSRRACTLEPERAEYLDTLAHCYDAMGKAQDAVEMQRKAVELKPHHPVLREALSRFEKKLNP
jgi:tetratricopeptide (TPR) repeat protein